MLNLYSKCISSYVNDLYVLRTIGHHVGVNYHRNYTIRSNVDKDAIISSNNNVDMLSDANNTICVIKVPQMGPKLDKCKIQKWLKKPGDYVNVDDILCTVETEHTLGKVYSRVSGKIIETVCQEGCNVSVGGDLALVMQTDPKSITDGEEM